MLSIGEKIKRAIKQSPFTISEVAKTIGISNQNLYKIFKRDSVESKYIKKLSDLLNIPQSYFYNNQNDGEKIVFENTKENNGLLLKLKNENEQLKTKVKELSEQLEDKKMIIDLLKERKAISGHDLVTQVEDRNIEYTDFNDADAMLKSLGKQPIDFTNEAEKWEYIEQEVAKRKAKNK